MSYILIGALTIIIAVIVRWFAAAVLTELASYLLQSRKTRAVSIIAKSLRLIGAQETALEFEREMWAQQGALTETCKAAVALYEAVRSKGASLQVANTAISYLVWAGKYTDAIQFADKVIEDVPRQTTNDAERALPLMNSAEALYNRGLWKDAWARLEHLDGAVAGSRYFSAWLSLQRGWILAHEGRGELALALVESVSETDIKRLYIAELYFTRAAALLALGRFVDAETAVRAALDASVRLSSERNGYFLMGRVLTAAGRLKEAEKWFRQGAEHLYRGQGGDGLLAWGDCLLRLGRVDEATQAWSMAIERDPESESARIAYSRIPRRLMHPGGSAPISPMSASGLCRSQ